MWGVTVRHGKTTRTKYLKRDVHSYSIHITKKEVKGNFFTHSKLRNTIEYMKQRLSEGVRKIGRASIEVRPRWKLLVIKDFYPFSPTEKEKDLEYSHLLDHGIATFARIQIVKDLIKKYPEYRIRSARLPTPFVKDHLAKRKITPGKKYPLQEYLQLLQAYEHKREV